jgi:Zn finger protein HypA/HybF involved in hydrogenase expression
MIKLKRYTIEDFIDAVRNSISISQILKKLRLKPTGGNYKVAKRRIKLLNLDISHFTGQAHLKGKTHNWAKKIPIEEILIKESTYGGGSSKIKEKLFKKNILEKKCYKCGLTHWFKQELSLELDHINGDNTDNRIENLTILCPNCHSLTPTYRGRGKKNKKQKISFRCPKKQYFCKKCSKKITKNTKTGLCLKCAINANRKVKNRPSKEVLLQEIKENSYCVVGRKYGVSDNAVRKWLK